VYAGNCGDYWSTGFTHVNEVAPPNWHHHDVKNQACYWRGGPGGGVWASRSRHPGGVNVALGDASVRFISATIDLTTWQRLGARSDRQPVTVP